MIREDGRQKQVSTALHYDRKFRSSDVKRVQIIFSAFLRIYVGERERGGRGGEAPRLFLSAEIGRRAMGEEWCCVLRQHHYTSPTLEGRRACHVTIPRSTPSYADHRRITKESTPSLLSYFPPSRISKRSGTVIAARLRYMERCTYVQALARARPTKQAQCFLSREGIIFSRPQSFRRRNLMHKLQRIFKLISY